MKKRERHPRSLLYRLILAGVLAVGISIPGYLVFGRTAWIAVDLQTNAQTHFKIYWAHDGQGYDESRVGAVRINPAQTRYHFPIGNLGTIRKIRIDPSDSLPGRAKVRIRSLSIHQPGYAPVRFVSSKDFRMMHPVSGIMNLRVDSAGLLIAAENNDPQLEVRIAPEPTTSPAGVLGTLAVGIFLLMLLFFWIGADGETFTHVPVLLSFAAALLTLMAVFSRMNAHPDEYVHIAAALYYEDHLVPPEICAPGTEASYSVYGVSRLNSRELVYPLAGKFSRLLSVLPIEPHVRLRLFNVALFVLICLCCLRCPDSRILGAMFLISPQTWYIFSYFNSDAFALFVIFFLGYQVLGKDTLFNRYVKAAWRMRTVIRGVGLGLVFSTLFLIKKNFYIFIPFLALYLLWRLYFHRDAFPPPREVLLKSTFLVLVGIAPLAAGLFMDYRVKGANQTAQIRECREKMADAPYKPSTPLHKKHPWMYLNERGVSIAEMLTGYRWGVRSLKSAFGVYGYTTIAGPDMYYTLIQFFAAAFLIFACAAAFVKPRWENSLLFLIVVFCSVVLLSLALWRAWTVMLQPQGRYLLPIGVMSGFFFHRFRTQKWRIGLKAFFLVFFLLSVYSFIFVGMVNIPKSGL